MERKRCGWCNLKNPLYVKYHDEEWGVAVYDDATLFEFLVLEPFQAGLSWETILNKRENFRIAFDGFDPEKVCQYGPEKIEKLMVDKGIVRNRRKIEATINNAARFLEIQKEWGTFSKYLWHFTEGKIVYEWDKTSSELSDRISKDLKKRGMNFVGTTIIYSYLQAVGVINSHEPGCDLYQTYRCITLRDRPELKKAAAEWFHSKWGVSEEGYLKCMDRYLNEETEYGWYLCLAEKEIVGGLGVIENDFHQRKDLTPNVCAVYTEEAHRSKGICGKLLDMAVNDLQSKGISSVYLITDHTSFYERYGWEFLCMVERENKLGTIRMYIRKDRE